ncbi:hypothetical protein C8F04DRAFT_1195574 [Mycena alexandri]|uniref:Uncharacterized protein n=1 Tax=Mycena alexandri TaxID=1745969 RepID=A0AAD6S5L7_9AGAR|nr:hypothetical protein C8F04DRAFT_1195574 [Mycena alexandri]
MAAKKTTKPKAMFKPYDADDVPDIMPFPELSYVATTKSEEIPVPKLNEHQRSWILDVGVRGADLLSLKGKAASELYDQIKTDAFDAKAFQHLLQPTDRAEETHLLALVTAWKQKQRAKKRSNVAADDGDASDEEEDESAIQKVISNKRNTENAKRKTEDHDAASTPTSTPTAEAAALLKLLGLVNSTGRDKFRVDRHDDIQEYSKTLPDAMNAGGKFRKAEALLWAKENQGPWEAAAASREDVDWEECQKLVASGLKHMVETLNASGKFLPFVATMTMAWIDEEGKLTGGAGSRAFPRTSLLAKASRNKIRNSCEAAWTPCIRGLKSRSKMLMETVKNFLVESYQAAFGSEDIPWAAVARVPNEYYDAEVTFTSTGLVQLMRTEWYDLATTLASVAGAGTSGFFRKAPAAHDDGDGEERGVNEAAADEARRVDAAKAEEARRAERAKADEAKAEEARRAEQAKADEAKAEEARRVEQAKADEAKAEEARRVEQAKADEAKAEEARRAEQAKAEEARLEQAKADEAQAQQARRAEQAKVEEARVEQAKADEAKAGEARRKGGRKRKADQLVPEDGGLEGYKYVEIEKSPAKRRRSSIDGTEEPMELELPELKSVD